MDAIKFVMEGATALGGNIPGDAFVTKLRQFLATFYSFDRAFSKKQARGLDLDVVGLRRINPSIVEFKPRPRFKGYDAIAAAGWTVGQFASIRENQNADNAVPQDALDNLVELAQVRSKKIPSVTRMSVEYNGLHVDFDEKMEGSALVLRVERQIDVGAVWEAGISRGSLFGELRGVSDLDGERQFYVIPPSGASRVQCLFPESMREQMADNLWKLVRVYGYLRYDGVRPSPYLVEAEHMESVPPESGEKHFLDMFGAFRDYDMQEKNEFTL
jgi:hypothetical protein